MMNTPVQEAMDQFMLEAATIEEKSSSLERCMEMFAEYLLHYSDLFQEDEAWDEGEMDEWEEALGQYVENLFEGDSDAAVELGTLPLSLLEPEHFRDFLGWFVLREPGITSI